LIAITTPGGKASRSAVSRLFLQAGQTLFEEALTPLADDLAGRVQTRRDLVVGQTVGGIQDNPGSHHITIR
jgi:hypothetical protein